MVEAPKVEEPQAGHPMTAEEPGFLRLPNMADGTVPVRVGVILPLTSATPATRALAASMLKAAELALFDAGNRNILLIAADEGATPADAAAAASKLLDQGAEVIVGPLFGASVLAVAPLARDRGVPVLAFSTERTVAGKGVYLISFLPSDEIRQVVRYAAGHGHSNFAALVPQTAYGDVAAAAFGAAVTDTGGHVVDVQHFAPNTASLATPAQAIAKSTADAIFIPQGGSLLKALAPILSLAGADKSKVKLLGTGLWDDTSLSGEAALEGGWFAAPEPAADDAFVAKYRATYGAAPAQLAPLAYDALSLVALLAQGPAYHRYTAAALLDPNGFAGVDGIFRFNADGTAERGLAILEMTSHGPDVVQPAPKSFQKPAS
jgi:ABC-type branched-subunit amino acid transport system substrate-binding protein